MFPTLPMTDMMVRKMSRESGRHSVDKSTGEKCSGRDGGLGVLCLLCVRLDKANIKIEKVSDSVSLRLPKKALVSLAWAGNSVALNNVLTTFIVVVDVAFAMAILFK